MEDFLGNHLAPQSGILYQLYTTKEVCRLTYQAIALLMNKTTMEPVYLLLSKGYPPDKLDITKY